MKPDLKFAIERDWTDFSDVYVYIGNNVHFRNLFKVVENYLR